MDITLEAPQSLKYGQELPVIYRLDADQLGGWILAAVRTRNLMKELDNTDMPWYDTLQDWLISALCERARRESKPGRPKE